MLHGEQPLKSLVKKKHSLFSMSMVAESCHSENLKNMKKKVFLKYIYKNKKITILFSCQISFRHGRKLP